MSCLTWISWNCTTRTRAFANSSLQRVSSEALRSISCLWLQFDRRNSADATRGMLGFVWQRKCIPCVHL